MPPAQSGYQLSPGMWARLGYQVFDEEDALVETNENELSVLIGYGVLFPELEDQLDGLSEGQSRTVHLKPEHAFGERNPEAQVEVDRADFPEDVAAGDCYEAEDEAGRPVLLQVLDVTEEGVLVDSNHPLAGQTLRFEVTARGSPARDRIGAPGGRAAHSCSAIRAGTADHAAELASGAIPALGRARLLSGAPLPPRLK